MLRINKSIVTVEKKPTKKPPKKQKKPTTFSSPNFSSDLTLQF